MQLLTGPGSWRGSYGVKVLITRKGWAPLPSPHVIPAARCLSHLRQTCIQQRLSATGPGAFGSGQRSRYTSHSLRLCPPRGRSVHHYTCQTLPPSLKRILLLRRKLISKYPAVRGRWPYSNVWGDRGSGFDNEGKFIVRALGGWWELS